MSGNVEEKAIDFNTIVVSDPQDRIFQVVRGRIEKRVTLFEPYFWLDQAI